MVSFSMLKTVLICHDRAFDRALLAPWLASFSDLTGLVVLGDGPQRTAARARREIRRVGVLRFLDVAAFRVYYRLFHARQDAKWEAEAISAAASRYGELRPDLPLLMTDDANGEETVDFLERLAPDVAIARCKTLLDERVFSIPSRGPFVFP